VKFEPFQATGCLPRCSSTPTEPLPRLGRSREVVDEKICDRFHSVFLAVTVLITLGCGSSDMNPNRVLQTMVMAPVNPDAQNFPNGQVQFTATGTFRKTPSGWTLMGAGAASIATIRQTGLAQCVARAAGTVTVQASASANAANGHRGNLGRRFGHNDHELPVRRIFPKLPSKSNSASMQKAKRTASRHLMPRAKARSRTSDVGSPRTRA
jgi:hypothetical protein